MLGAHASIKISVLRTSGPCRKLRCYCSLQCFLHIALKHLLLATVKTRMDHWFDLVQ